MANLELVNPNDHEIIIEVRDMMGKILLHKNHNTSSGLQKIQLNLTGISAGTYYISIDNGEERIVKMLIID
jgi:hypothetical protein